MCPLLCDKDLLVGMGFAKVWAIVFLVFLGILVVAILLGGE